MNNTISVKCHNVNSEVLFRQIDKHIRSTIENLGNYWFKEDYRKLYLDHIEETIGEQVGNGKINQIKVISNEHNNTCVDNENGKYNIDIHYKQTHCLNVTTLSYVVQYDGDLLYTRYE